MAHFLNHFACLQRKGRSFFKPAMQVIGVQDRQRKISCGTESGNACAQCNSTESKVMNEGSSLHFIRVEELRT